MLTSFLSTQRGNSGVFDWPANQNVCFFIVKILPFPLTWGKGQKALNNEKNLGIIESISAMRGLASATLSDQASREPASLVRRTWDLGRLRLGVTTY